MSDTFRVSNLYSSTVGIGTSSASAILHVVSPSTTWSNVFQGYSPNITTQGCLIVIGKSATTNNNLSVQYNHVADGSASNYGCLQMAGVGNILCWTAGSSVGIGITNPSQPLHVYGTAAQLLHLQNTTTYARMILNGSSGTGGDIIFQEAGTSKYGIACIAGKLQFLLSDASTTIPITMDTAGNVGIGAASPSATFHVAGDGTSAVLTQLNEIKFIGNGNSHWSIFGARSGHAYFSIANTSTNGAIGTAGTDVLCITTANNVGIGTNSPNDTLTIQSPSIATATGTSAYCGIHFQPVSTTSPDYYNGITWSGNQSANNNTHAGILVQGSGAYGTKMRFYTTDSWVAGQKERMVINHSGYVGIATASPSFPLHVYGGTGLSYSTSGNNPYLISPNISVGNNTGPYGAVCGWFEKDLICGGAVGTFSDQRIKTNIQVVNNALSTIDQLRMVSHGYIDQIENPNSCSFGLIAQEVIKVIPDAVTLSKNFIPNIMVAPRTATIVDGEIEMTFDSSIDLKVNDLVRFILKDRQVEQTVVFVSNEQLLIRVTAWSDPDPVHDQIFVYGKQVDDFHILDKPKMGLLALAGVKELHEIIKKQADTIDRILSWATTHGFSM